MEKRGISFRIAFSSAPSIKAFASSALPNTQLTHVRYRASVAVNGHRYCCSVVRQGNSAFAGIERFYGHFLQMIKRVRNAGWDYHIKIKICNS